MLRAMRTTTASAGKWNRAFSPSLSRRAPLPSRPASAHAVTRTSSATAALNDAVSLVASVTLATLRSCECPASIELQQAGSCTVVVKAFCIVLALSCTEFASSSS